MRSDDIHLRAHSSVGGGGHERRQVRCRVRHRKFQCGNLYRVVDTEHRGNHRVVQLDVLARRQAVDVVFVEDAPPRDRVLRVARRHESSSAPGETTLVVIPH